MFSRFLAAIAILALPIVAAAATPGYAVVGRIAGPDGGWDLLGVDAAHRLYVARSGAVMAADLVSGVVTPALVPLTRNLQDGIVMANRDLDSPASYQAASQRINACP